MAAELFSLAKGTLKPLVGKLLEIRETRKADLQRLADGFGDPFELAQFYVEPDCQHFPPADENEEESPTSLREPILRLVERYLSGPALHSRQHMFILSDAGMGKTSLLTILRLTQLTAFWPKDHHCELFKLGEKTLADIAALKDVSNTILLLDALDEDPLAWGRVEDRLEQILKATQLFRRTLITCRTQFFHAGEAPYSSRGQVEVSGFDCPVIYNSLFSDDQCIQYLERKSTQHRDDPRWLDRAQSIALKMGTLKMRPMMLAHIDDLMEEDAGSWTEYELYARLVRSWLKREQRKIRGETDTYPSVDELLRACRNLAIALHGRKLRNISKDELNELIQDTPETRHIEFMHVGGRSLLNRDSRGNYRFSHYSIQEFLVVSAILEGVMPVRELLVQGTDFMTRLLAIWWETATPQQKEQTRLDLLSLRGARFPQRSLKNVDFSSADLSEADFTGADLVGASFAASTLIGSSFGSANLDQANFRNADMEGARLEGCSGVGTQFQWAKLNGANLCGSQLTKANLNFAQLRGARYSQATRWPLTVDPVKEGAVLVEDSSGA